MQEIQCEKCERVFLREPQRGRKPTRCPECKGEASDASNPFAALAPVAGNPFDTLAPARPSVEVRSPPVKRSGVVGEKRNPFPTGIVRPHEIVPARVGIHYRILWGENLMSPTLYTERDEAFDVARTLQADELPRHEGGAIYRIAKIEILSLDGE